MPWSPGNAMVTRSPRLTSIRRRVRKVRIQPAQHDRLIAVRIACRGGGLERLSPRLCFERTAATAFDALTDQLSQQFANRLAFLACDPGKRHLQCRLDTEGQCFRFREGCRSWHGASGALQCGLHNVIHPAHRARSTQEPPHDDSSTDDRRRLAARQQRGRDRLAPPGPDLYAAARDREQLLLARAATARHLRCRRTFTSIRTNSSTFSRDASISFSTARLRLPMLANSFGYQ